MSSTQVYRAWAIDKCQLVSGAKAFEEVGSE